MVDNILCQSASIIIVNYYNYDLFIYEQVELRDMKYQIDITFIWNKLCFLRLTVDIRNHVTVTTITSSHIISAKTNSDVSNYCGPVGMTSDSHGDDPGSIPHPGRKKIEIIEAK